LADGILSQIWWSLSSSHFELSHSIFVGGTPHMGVVDHGLFSVSLADFFFLRIHNNFQHQSAHEGENYALEHLSHAVLYGQNGHHEGF
jgi:hypothetical protein